MYKNLDFSMKKANKMIIDDNQGILRTLLRAQKGGVFQNPSGQQTSQTSPIR